MTLVIKGYVVTILGSNYTQKAKLYVCSWEVWALGGRVRGVTWNIKWIRAIKSIAWVLMSCKNTDLLFFDLKFLGFLAFQNKIFCVCVL